MYECFKIKKQSSVLTLSSLSRAKLYFDQTNGIVKASDLYEFILYKVLGATYLGAENTELMIIDVVLRFYG